MKRSVILLLALLLACLLSSCNEGADAPSRMTEGTFPPQSAPSQSAPPQSVPSQSEEEISSRTETDTEAARDSESGAPSDGILPRIDAPAPVFNYETAVLSWEPVENAVGYVVTVNGAAMAEQTEASYAFGEDGVYTVTVRAIAGEGYRNSRLSEAVVFTIGWSSVPVV